MLLSLLLLMAPLDQDNVVKEMTKCETTNGQPDCYQQLYGCVKFCDDKSDGGEA